MTDGESDVEIGVCDFCGEQRLVAVSEQVKSAVRICEACAGWAADEIHAHREATGADDGN